MLRKEGKKIAENNGVFQKAPTIDKSKLRKYRVKRDETISNDKRGSWLFDADRKDLISIIDKLPIGVAIVENTFGKCLYVNDQILVTLYHYPSITPSTRSLFKKIIPDAKERAKANKFWEQTVKAGGGTSPPFKYLCGDGKFRSFECKCVVLRKDLIVNMWMDVTQRENAEAELQESEARFRTFFEKSTDPFLLFDGKKMVNCNLAALQLFNCQSKGKMIGKTLESLSPEKQSDGRLTNKKVVSLFKTVLKYGNHRTEWIIRTNNRKEIPVELSIAAIKLKGENILFIVLRDITPWKEAQNVLLHAKIVLEDAVKARTSELIAVNEELTSSRERLRHLSEYLQQAREDERTRIAREVHDHVGQFLTGLKMNLVYQIQNPQGDIGVLVEQTKLMVDEIDEVIHSVQGICSELRPTILGHFGLTAAIGWYLKDFEKRTGIRCKARTDSRLPLLDKNLDTLLFRIFQEVMTNIFRHAHATMVSVRLKCEGNALTLKIKDNGRGILKEEALHPRSFGIIGIRERVRFWGGQSDFKGVPGKGTIVTIWLPINNNLSKQRETKGSL